MRSVAASYRPNVGAAVFDCGGRVLIARRRGNDGPEVVYPGFEWQLPQGGIDAGEEAAAAVIRELREETGIVSVVRLGMLTQQVTYDWPPYSGPPHPLTAWVGQRQTWFAFRFVGDESEISFDHAAPGDEPEFDAWRWAPLEELPGLVVPYKRPIYERIAAEFAPFAHPERGPESGLVGRSSSGHDG